MRRFCRFIALVAVLLTCVGASAQLRTSYFMEGTYFRTELNPALKPTRGYLALPGISGVGVNVGSNFLSLDDLFYQSRGQYFSVFDGSMTSDEVMARFPELSNLRLNANVNVLGVGFYSRKTYWNIGLNARVQSFAQFSNDMFGNLVGSSMRSIKESTYDSTSFLETYLGTSFHVHKNVNIGFRVKALFGALNVNGRMLQAGNGSLMGRYVVSGMCVDKHDQKRNGEIYDASEVFKKDAGYMLEGDVNFGLALDLGFEARLANDHLRISAAITDLGYIKWNSERMKGVEITSDFNFDGAGIEQVAKGADVEHSYTSRPYVGKRSADTRRMLNFGANVGIEYAFLRNHISIGVMSHNEFCSNTLVLIDQSGEPTKTTKQNFHEITASLNLRPTNWLSATVSKTFLVGEDIDIFGVALNIHPRGLNIFIGADFVDSKFVRGPKGSVIFGRPTSHSIYAGVGFNFGRPTYVRMASAELKAERKAERQQRREQRQAK